MGVEPTTLWLQSVSLLKFSKGMYRLCLDRMSDPRACGLHWRTATACRTRFLGRTKTTTADDRTHVVVLIGRPVEALKRWIEEARIDTGPVFRRIDQWGNIDRRALTPQSVNLILKTRCSQAGLDPELFSAHGLRSGYLTEAANRGIPLKEACSNPCTSRGAGGELL